MPVTEDTFDFNEVSNEMIIKQDDEVPNSQINALNDSKDGEGPITHLEIPVSPNSFHKGAGKVKERVMKYICSYCDKHFSQTSHLKSHLKTHTKEKPYLCTECEKTFARPGDLRRHQL